MIIERYEPRMQDEWDEFVEDSYNGTIFHKQRFLLYHNPKKFKDKSIIFRDNKGHILSVFPSAIIDNCLNSHPGSSFGGPVFKYSGIKSVLFVIEKIIAYARELGVDSILLRLPPNIVQSYPIEAVEFSLFFKGFKQYYVELSTCVPIGAIKPKEAAMRAAQKASSRRVYIRESVDFDLFWPILQENLKRHNATPTHTLTEIEKIKSLFPQDIKLFGAYYKDELISGTVLFINNKVSFETFYIAQNYEFSSLNPNNLLMLKVLEWAAFQGFKFLNFGVSTENHGKKINFGLTKFKESFGGCDIVRRTYKMEL